MAENNARPISIFATYIVTNVSLTALVVSDIHRVYSSSKRTADSSSASRSGTKRVLHGLLSALCLSVTWYYMISFFSLSYRSWAFDHHVPLPQGYSDVIQDLSKLKLGPWLKDVQLFRDAWETVAETAGRYVWTLPIFFITTGWSLFIAREAQLYKIRHAWAYMVLGQLVAISFAMNLFYLAVLAYKPPPEPPKLARKGTVIKKAEKTSDAPNLWMPRWLAYIPLILLSTGTAVLLPARAGTKYFLHFLALPHVLLLVPPMFSTLLPASLVTKDRYMSLYAIYLRIVVIQAIAAQVAITLSALDDKGSGKHAHRHSNVSPPSVRVGESQVDSVLLSLVDHPAVSSVGWDSMLCFISIFTWRYT